jgi:trk system potassium uptake protein TrkH
MKDLLPVLRVLGMLMIMFAGAMLLPFGISWFTQDGIWRIYPWSIGLTVGVGLLLWGGLHRHKQDLQPRHGVILVTLVWVVLPLCAMVPLVMGLNRVGISISFTHAYFEAVSGLTTTGATVLSGLDQLPVSINVWRTFMQWMGGMGILILAVAVLPLLGSVVLSFSGRRPPARSRTPSSHRVLPKRPRACGACTRCSPWLFPDLLGLRHAAAGCADAYVRHGESGRAVVARCQLRLFQFAAAGGRGPAVHAAGQLQLCAVLRGHAQGRIDSFMRDPEMRATIGVLLGSGLLVALLLWVKGVYGPLDALRNGMFHTVSVATTTGFSTTDYLSWPVFIPVLLLLLSGVATSAGSTGGGIKMVRMLILVKQARREMTRLVHPRAVQPVRLGDAVVDNPMIFSVLAYMLVYGATVIVLSMVLLLTDLDPLTAFSAVLASVHCMGPGLGAVGPASNYTVLTDFQIWVCTLGMLLGRLEILSFMALLSPAFWRR